MSPDSDGPVRVLGIEGTAWAASAAVYDEATDAVAVESDAYAPESGGIHPREAAEHMQERLPAMVERALELAREGGAGSEGGDHVPAADGEPPVDAVAFSRGPGLGPCLRVVGAAARAAAQVLDVPLVGVNHMVAHLEIGRGRSGFSDPVCLNASGANAHVLGYHDGRYRVLGETMDTGVGNAIDKFTRHLGWSHPGGPKVEARAKEGAYHDLPYVVKGMDFSFSGIMSAAKDAVDDGVAVADVCRGLEETVFAMLAEVSERALSLTGSDELVLGGGVAQNDRLRSMLRAMCEERGAEFFVPEDRFLRDNAGMIAVLGATMLAAGDTVAVAESTVRPQFRPDEVPVTWRDAGASGVARTGGDGSDEDTNDCGAVGGSEAADRGAVVGREAVAGSKAATREAADRGAEAVVERRGDRVVKRRLPKGYRHPDLDERLRGERTVMEARLTAAARRAGVPTPLVYDVDVPEATLTLQHVGEADLAAALTADRVRTVGGHLAAVHGAGFVHGDPTTRNVRVDPERTFLIDFGLGFHTDDVEDHAMDLHVLGQSLDGTAEDPAAMRAALVEGYRERAGTPDAVLDRLREIEGRGRYQ